MPEVQRAMYKSHRWPGHKTHTLPKIFQISKNNLRPYPLGYRCYLLSLSRLTWSNHRKNPTRAICAAITDIRAMFGGKGVKNLASISTTNMKKYHGAMDWIRPWIVRSRASGMTFEPTVFFHCRR